MTWLIMTVLLATGLCRAEIHENPGSKEPLPHDKYIRVVSEKVSPVQREYIKTKDGLYVAAAIRKPAGNGPFPALIHFHGAPGGRGIEQLSGWVLGTTGGPMWERFLEEGFAVIVADYRGGSFPRGQGLRPEDVTYADDGVAVVEYVRSLPYIDKDRITLYGVSLGGDVALHVISRTKVHSAILGAPAPINFLGATSPPAAPGAARTFVVNDEIARRNIEPVATPILILVGTADSLINLDRPLHDALVKAGKQVRMEVYANGYHDFVMGPQGQSGRSEPLLDSTLSALETAVLFAKRKHK